ncbi:MAG: polysaccharide deacetylase family protein [Pseudomonadales bacterium]
MINALTPRLARVPERLRRRVQAQVSKLECARHGDPLRHHPRPVITTFFDVEGDYAMPGMQQACIGGVEKILEIQQGLGIKSTYNVVAKLALDAPSMIAAIHDCGHEVASHSLQHRTLTRLSSQDLARDVSQTRAAFERLGVQISGHRSPQSAWTRSLLDELAMQQFRWNAEDGSEPHPYPVANAYGERLWRFPVRDDDWHYEASGMKPAVLLERWQKAVDTHVGAGRYVAIGFHPWVQRHPERLSVFKDFMCWLREYPGVDILPFGGVLELFDTTRSEPESFHGH